MKTIEYTPDGLPFADAHVESLAREFLLSPVNPQRVEVSTDNFVHAVRALVCEGLISHTEVEFVYEGKVIRCDGDGRIQDWPRGFCDVTEGFLCRILTTRRA